MLVSPKYKLLYVHIPKTGGTSFKKLIKRNDSKSYEHKNYHAPLRKEDHDKFKDYNKIVIVRNSFELCASCYRFECSGVRKDEKFKKTLGMDFATWIDWKNKNNDIDHAVFPKQLDFFRSRKKEILVDKIIDYSKIKKEISDLCEQYDIPDTFPTLKAHYYGDYNHKSVYKNKKNIELVKEICKEDIEFFGWKL